MLFELSATAERLQVAVPAMAQEVIDRAIQAHGAAGVSQDFPLAEMYAHARILRIADGPDEVHRRSIARLELKRVPNRVPRVERVAGVSSG